MSIFKHSLHHSGLWHSPYEAELTRTLQQLARHRFAAIEALPPGAPLAVPLAAPGAGARLPLSTVTYQPAPGSPGNFDSLIDIQFDGAPANGTAVPLLLDSGNTVLIVPDYDALANLPGYQILAANVTEPWKCPAHIVRGPITLATSTGGVVRIPQCVFYACTAANPDGDRTANFGLGYLYAWTVDGTSGVTVQAPLSYLPGIAFVEVDIRAAPGPAAAPQITETSSLTLYGQPPPGYRMFASAANTPWMSLVPQSLTIAGTATGWAGQIAMIDTGGGPAYLSDPAGVVYDKPWPNLTLSPGWTDPGSQPCESTTAPVTVTIGDNTGGYTYTLDVARLPASVQGMVMVLCQTCEFMFGWNGMNVGGITMLTNLLLIDYTSGRVGFKPKPV